MPPLDPRPVLLSGRHVRLEPLERGHLPALLAAVNTEAKFLQLSYAFEALGAVRVQLKTGERNTRSRAAIARLGATFEGILRRYRARYEAACATRRCSASRRRNGPP